MIVTNKLIKNVNFNIFTSNEGAICTETSNFIAAHVLITLLELYMMTCVRSVRGMIIATHYKEDRVLTLRYFPLCSSHMKTDVSHKRN